VTSVIAARGPATEGPAVAVRRIAGVAAALFVVLLVAAPGYGYHRDELYFRLLGRHLSWGYVDQPPLTPALARLATTLFGDNIVALRVPAALGAAVTVVLTALIARELGGSAAAQLRTAAGTATAALVLVSGHVFLTASVDIPLTAAVVLLATKAMLHDPRWWLAAGAVAGVALYNKLLVVLLGLALAVALLIDLRARGRETPLLSRWFWLGALTALVVGLPNLIYQVVNDWPQIDMARAINRTDGGENRALFAPLQLVIVGPFLLPTIFRGFSELFRRTSWRPVRALAIAYPIGCIVTVITGGQAYYVFNLLLFFYAAGCVAVTGRRVGPGWIPIALNGAVAALIALPIIPLSALGKTPIPEINPATQDQIGWTRMAADVAAAYRTIPERERARVVVLTENYGEAGAVDRYGAENGMADVGVYSGQNALWGFGPPPEDSKRVITIGLGPVALSRFFTGCGLHTIFDNGVGVDNEEQGEPIAVCNGPAEPWSQLWPRLRHLS
jgi:4-amino-4-deoxy-L-arabinose transferase-like glycosyltransferase